MNGTGVHAPVMMHQFVAEQKMFWREPTGAVFTFAFPLFFLTIFAELFNRDRAVMQKFTPTMIAFGIITACFTNLVILITIRRETGVFKRKRTTPLSMQALLGGLVASVVVVAIVLCLVLTLIGAVFYHVRPTHSPLALLIALTLGAACFCALGVMVANVTPSVEAAPAVAQGVLYPIAFISDTFIKAPSGSVIRKVASIFPVRHFNDAVIAAFGHGQFAWRHYAVLVVWTAGGVALAARKFRWMPRLS